MAFKDGGKVGRLPLGNGTGTGQNNGVPAGLTNLTQGAAPTPNPHIESVPKGGPVQPGGQPPLVTKRR